MSDPRRTLPSVERLLQAPAVRTLLEHAPRNVVVAAAREVIAAAREGRGPVPEDWAGEVVDGVARRTTASLHPGLNATGVVLHTNLGRAPLAQPGIAAVQAGGARRRNLGRPGATGA